VATVADLLVRIRGDASGFTASIKKATRDLDGFGAQAVAVGKMAAVGLAVGGGIAVAVGLQKAAQASLSFESAFTGVIKTVGGTKAEMDDLRQRIRSMSTEMPVAATELARIGEIAGALGISGTDNLAKFIDTISRITVSTDLTTDAAATGFARLATVLQVPIAEVDKLASAVVALGNEGSSTEAEILAFAQRIAGGGQLVGFTTAQVLALSSTLPQLGIEAEMGGTAIQQALLKINTATVKGGDDLKVLADIAGITSAQFSKQWNEDAFGAFQQFVAGLGASGDQAVLLLDDLGLDGARSAQTFLKLAQSGALLNDSLNIASGGIQNTNALMNESNRVFQTGQAQIDIFGNRVTNVLITIGDKLMPHVLRAFGALNTWFDTNGPKLVAIWNAAVPALLLFGKGLLFIGQVFGEVIAWVIQFISAHKSLQVVLLVIAGLLIAVFAPVPAAIAVVVLALGILRDHWREVFNGMIGVAEAMVNGVIAAFNWMVGKIEEKINKVGAAWNAVAGVFGLGKVGTLELGRVEEQKFERMAVPEAARSAGDELDTEQMAKTAKAADSALKLNAGLGAISTGADETSKALDKLKSALEGIASAHTSQLVEAYSRGGMTAVGVVQKTQARLDAQWIKVAADLHDKLGIQVPEEHRLMWEGIQAELNKGKDQTLSGLLGFLAARGTGTGRTSLTTSTDEETGRTSTTLRSGGGNRVSVGNIYVGVRPDIPGGVDPAPVAQALQMATFDKVA